MNIIKRDGREVPFDKTRIVTAVLKAFKAVDGEASEYAITKAYNIADQIESQIEQSQSLTIDEIQNLVECGLMSTKRKDVAKAYIQYRHKRDVDRNNNDALRKRIKEKLAAKNVKNQNANLDEYAFGGRIGEASSEMLRDIALNDGYMSEMARSNHLNNEIYIHDLDHYVIGSHNCLSIPFDDLLKNGFVTRQTDVRGAQSISTAFQLVAVIFQLQSLMQFGGVSSTHLDWTLVPYVRKSFYKHYIDGLEWVDNHPSSEKIIFFKNLKDSVDELSIEDDRYLQNSKVYNYAMTKIEKETAQAVEGLYHNLKKLGRLNSNVQNPAS